MKMKSAQMKMSAKARVAGLQNSQERKRKLS